MANEWLSYSLANLEDLLTKRRKEKMENEAIQRQIAQQGIENQFRTQQLGLQERQFAEAAAERQRDNFRQQQADMLGRLQLVSPDEPLSEGIIAEAQAAKLSPYLNRKEGRLPSTQFQGFSGPTESAFTAQTKPGQEAGIYRRATAQERQFGETNRRLMEQAEATRGFQQSERLERQAFQSSEREARAADQRALQGFIQSSIAQRQQGPDINLGLDQQAASAALARATADMGPAQHRQWINTANRAAQSGDTNTVKSIIRQAAVEGEPVDARNRIMARITMRDSLARAENVLAQMRQAGVPTNILTGTAEDVVRKLGTTTNPQYVQLKNILMDTLITYRRAATGVQFSQPESEQYRAMFPNYSNTFPVNEALIKGLRDSIDTQDRAYWEFKLGPEGANFIGAPQRDPGANTKPAVDAGPGTRGRFRVTVR
jgi:hypothetical protein